MMALRRARLRLLAAQEGVAMIMVIGIGSVMTLMIVGAVAMALGTMNKSKDDQDWNAALAAAYAAIEEYQSRLSEEPAYVKYGNPASTFSSPTLVQLPTAAKVNPAFGVGASGTWADVKEAVTNKVLFSYRYEVDNSKYSTTGTIRLRATGRVGTETRSIIADVRQTGFIDYMWFTDYEMSDPTIVDQGCDTVHAWEDPSERASCTIQFAAFDTLSGPVHSNDTIVICGAHFKSTVTTGRPTGGYSKPSGCSNGVFDAGQPVYSPYIEMPDTNTQLIKETRSDLISSDVPRPGCLYTGPTKITLQSGGMMNVRSPWTKATNIVGDPATSGNNTYAAQCGSITALQSAAGATIPVLQNNLLYVQNIPLTGVNSATAAATTTTGSNTRCKNLAGTSLTSDSGVSQNVVGYPANNLRGVAANDEKPLIAGTGTGASYGCRNGDLFISGTLTGGAMTVAAQNYVYVTDNITYGNSDTDMLGIIGQNSVWVYNPVTNGNAIILPDNREIDAAILSLEHSFAVQNYTITSLGTLTVKGSIALKYRGIVGTGSNGYAKNYLYDPRYKYTAPPKFLSPVTTTYGINVWVEISPVFNTNGTYR